MRFRHTRYQHPIGQGLFHSAEILIGNESLSYVYDYDKPLQREVSRYVERRGADKGLSFLFVSHLDLDHVSGLDKLLSVLKVYTVLLPYFQPIERLICAIRAVENGRIDNSYLQLVANPGKWFTDRGVSTVVFVDGDDDPEGGTIELPGEPFPFERIDGKQDRIRIHPHYFPNTHTSDAELIGAGLGDAEIFRMSHKTPLPLSINSQIMNWVLATHVYPAGEKLEDFRLEVLEQFPDAPFDNGMPVEEFTLWLLDTVKSRESRSRLKKCYSKIITTHNSTSMSLYSGPIVNNLQEEFVFEWQIRRSGWFDIPFHYRRHQCGWLGTGDADLKGNARVWPSSTILVRY